VSIGQQRRLDPILNSGPFAQSRPAIQPKVCKTFCGKDSDDKCDDFEDGKIRPLEYEPCYPICADQCAKTRSSLTWEACIVDCLMRTRC
jgi:hypothetical protein